MVLSRISDASAPLSPVESVQQYRNTVLSGQSGVQPLPRTVMTQGGKPKVPYPAKSGSGMPTALQTGIFNVIRQQAPIPRKKAPLKAQPSGGGAGYVRNEGGAKLSTSGDRSGAYGLTSQAGAKLQALQQAYQRQFGQNLSVLSGGRSYADQVKAYNNYLRGGNLAAKPGTSVHESGRAVDFGGAAHGYSKQHTWLVQNAPKFGWTWAGKNFSQVEPWHFEYQG